jgi:uncharacterized protein YqkB
MYNKEKNLEAHMRLQLDELAKEKFLGKLNAREEETVVLFDYDDGVGPLSIMGSCSMNVHFRFVFVSSPFESEQFDAEIESNVGPIRMKGYSKMYINGDNPRIEYNKSYGTFVFKTDNEIVDSNAEIIDFRSIDLPTFKPE